MTENRDPKKQIPDMSSVDMDDMVSILLGSEPEKQEGLSKSEDEEEADNSVN